MRRTFLVLFVLTLYLRVAGYAQQPVAAPDSTRGAAAENPPAPPGEIVLETIEIQGRVDKPGVIILPKRLSPDIEAVELDRSFEQEVKQGIGDVPKGEASLRKLEPVKSIKKAVEKER